MKKFVVMAAMMAAFCTACSDDEKDCAVLNGIERCDLSTDHGAVICDSNVRYMNQNGTYEVYACDTGYACVSGGVCTRMPECIDSAVPMSCSGNTLTYCSGGVMRYEVCPEHTVCNIDATTGHGACVVKPAANDCVAGSERCNINGVHQVCSDPGNGNVTWVDSPCGAGMTCSGGSCVLANPCIPNDKRCYYDNAGDSYIVQTCSANKVWETSDICDGETTACSNGTCVVPSEEPDPGENPGGSEYVNCSDEECTLNDGTTILCGEACVDMAGPGNEAWCTADGQVACSPTDPSGSSGSSNYYDCTDEACTDSQTCGEYCASKGYQNQAWCDDMYAYCENPSGG